jgi:hypothetical protein
MARDQGLDDQIDGDEELLNFDLDDLSLSEDLDEETGAEDEIIELIDLVERGASEDITRDLKIREWSAASSAKEGEKGAPPQDAAKMAAADEAELDLSDISLELDEGVDEEKASDLFSKDEITEADLEELLQEEEGITLDLPEEGLETEQKAEDEISEETLQALLSETGEENLVKGKGKEEPLISDEVVEELDMERLEETQALDFKSNRVESLLAEEPSVILAKEVEELGAAAALEEKEAVADEGETSEPEEEPETVAASEFEEEDVQAEEEEKVSADRVLAGISEERLEEIIEKVVGEVVERVARVTMAEVAERMIGEAIQSLKQNLESSEP